jgi:hypothetical protein
MRARRALTPLLPSLPHPPLSSGTCLIPGPIQSQQGQISTFPYFRICGSNNPNSLLTRPLVDNTGFQYGSYYVFRDYSDIVRWTVTLVGSPTVQPFFEFGIQSPSFINISFTQGIPDSDAASQAGQ